MPDTFLPVVQPGRPASPPIFGKIAVVGLGLIGGSIALAARRLWPDGLVIGVDDKAVLERAMVLHAIDVAADDLIVAAEADLVVLAAPVSQNVEIVGRLADHVRGPAIVTDVGSTKRAIVAAARALPPRFTFVGGHPLGGAARHGIDFARPDLFQDRPWIFTPDDDRTGTALERLFAFATGLGARPRTLGPDEHDRLLAYLSHLPQLAASALMTVVGEGAREDALALAGRGLVDTTRLASSPASVWSDICRTNGDNIDEALERLITVLQELRRGVGSTDVVERVFDAANHWRERLDAVRAETGS
jgi:prephenate dehydrogenase